MGVSVVWFTLCIGGVAAGLERNPVVDDSFMMSRIDCSTGDVTSLSMSTPLGRECGFKCARIPKRYPPGIMAL